MAEIIEERVNKLIINQLTREEYRDLKERDLINRNEIYLFPDTTEDELEALKEKVNELIESNNGLIDIVIEGSSENPSILDTLYGRDGQDGLVDIVNYINERVTIIERWIDSHGSEGTVSDRVTTIENIIHEQITPQITQLNTTVQNLLQEIQDLLLYCGNSTDVMDESSEV